MPLRTGLDRLLSDPPAALKSGRLGWVTNRAALTRDLRFGAAAAQQAGLPIVALFAPEHGLHLDLPAGANVPQQREPRTGLPVYSLYGADAAALAPLLRGLTHLVIDLPDVGVRFFTYAATMLEVMRAAAEAGVPVTVLDRPNPLGGEVVAGPRLSGELVSEIGPLEGWPVRHGMTMGEIAHFAQAVHLPHLDLRVVRLRGWSRGTWFPGWRRAWVPPSPNLPHWENALAYPGTALLEGTNLSEGRGTPNPFLLVGAPWLAGEALSQALNQMGLPGVRFRPVRFRPCRSKHAGEVCEGVQVHITAPRRFRPVRTGLAILVAVRDQQPQHLTFLEHQGRYFFDLLLGDAQTRARLQAGDTFHDLIAPWPVQEAAFQAQRRAYWLYPE